MKKRMRDNIKTIILIIPLIILTRLPEALPWWSFVVPVMILGIIITLKKWEVSGFMIGFLPGFLIWVGANLYFDAMLPGDVLKKIGLLLSVPKIIVLLISGITGGLVTGLALYTGKAMVYKEKLSL